MREICKKLIIWGGLLGGVLILIGEEEVFPLENAIFTYAIGCHSFFGFARKLTLL